MTDTSDFSSQAIAMSQKNINSQKANQFAPIFFILIFGLGVGVILKSYFYETHNNEEKKQTQILMSQLETSKNFVTEDFKRLYKENKLPEFFLKLKKITWAYREADLKDLIPENSVPFRPINSGLYNLEIEAFSAPSEKTRVIVLQFNLFEIKSGNKVFELSRNYEIPNN